MTILAPPAVTAVSASPAIRVEGLEKTYADGTRALRGVDLTVSPGEGVVVLGHNGCGKSTLMKCLTGIERPTGGRILVGDVDPAVLRGARLRALRHGIGCVFQKFNLVGNVSVLQNVLFGALGRHGLLACVSPLARTPLRAQALDALARVGLATLAGRRADTLSGGQQQRVAIARMLMQEARVVLADEPVASLDPKAGREVMDLLWSIVRERGLTVICVLHQLELAREYADRLVGLAAGRVVFDSPAHQVTATQLETLYAGTGPAREAGT